MIETNRPKTEILRFVRRRNYAELLWQSGALGQVLYLAAEAAGFGATGVLVKVGHNPLGMNRPF